MTLRDVTIGLRLRADDKELVRKVCEARGEDISDFVRRAILKELARLSFLSGDQKKALGFPPRGGK